MSHLRVTAQASKRGRPSILGRAVRHLGVGGLTDHLLTPSYSTAIGLLLWAARVVTAHDAERYEVPPASAGWNRIRELARRLFP